MKAVIHANQPYMLQRKFLIQARRIGEHYFIILGIKVRREDSADCCAAEARAKFPRAALQAALQCRTVGHDMPECEGR